MINEITRWKKNYGRKLNTRIKHFFIIILDIKL